MTLLLGDSLERLKELPADSVDACVCDPPYGLSFMNKHWDYDVPKVELWREVYRVLKPGGHLLSFGGTRTYHRMVVAIEDAGFEIRDMLSWLYGSGFPKSMDVSKAIDKQAGAEREVIGLHPNPAGNKAGGNSLNMSAVGMPENASITAPATEDAKRWQGWGTALKPAVEPIVMARKPLEKSLTVAANVVKYGTGALNIDASRIVGYTNLDESSDSKSNKGLGEKENGGGRDCDELRSLQKENAPLEKRGDARQVAADLRERVPGQANDEVGQSALETGPLELSSGRLSIFENGSIEQVRSKTSGESQSQASAGTPDGDGAAPGPETPRDRVSASHQREQIGQSDRELVSFGLAGPQPGASQDHARVSATQSRERQTPQGRWPSNLILDEEAAAALDEQSGERAGSTRKVYKNNQPRDGRFGEMNAMDVAGGYGDSGGASRFFLNVKPDASDDITRFIYCAKASKRERFMHLTCGCEVANQSAWLKPDQNLSEQTGFTSPAKATSERISTENSSLGTSSHGNLQTVPCPLVCKSTTSTETIKTTGSKTYSSSPQRSTSDFIQDASLPMASGSSPAQSAECLSPSTQKIGTSPEKAGRSMGVAVHATLAESLKKSVCAVCGESPKSEGHPTQKPIRLMEYLVRMITPPGGTVLDPFLGSGSTLVAAARLGFKGIGCEMSPEYLEIARRRIEHAQKEITQSELPLEGA